MRLISSVIFCIVLTTFVARPASFFSSAEQGIGLRQYVTTAQGMGMGATGLASPDSMTLNAYNIASWRHINNTKISILMRYDMNETDFGTQTVSTSTGNFNGLHLGIPIKQHEWVFGLSIIPYTMVDFSYLKQRQIASTQYRERIEFDGNISRLQANLVWSPDERLGVSASFHYYFGTIRDRYELRFDSNEFYDSSHEVEYEFQGPGVGLSVDFQAVEWLRFGGFIDLKPSLEFAKVTRSPITLTERERETESTLPVSWGLGSSYAFTDRWKVNADIAYQHWSKGFDIENLNTNRLDDWYHAGVGVERAHSTGRTVPFLNKFDWRVGLSAGNIGYRFNDNPVYEYSGHFGLGIPFYQDRARFDIAFIAGIRGNKDETIASETFYRFVFSISAGELWFQKFR